MSALLQLRVAARFLHFDFCCRYDRRALHTRRVRMRQQTLHPSEQGLRLEARLWRWVGRVRARMPRWEKFCAVHSAVHWAGTRSSCWVRVDSHPTHHAFYSRRFGIETLSFAHTSRPISGAGRAARLMRNVLNGWRRRIFTVKRTFKYISRN